MTAGSIQNRETFLNNVAKNLGRGRINGDVAKPEWQHRPQWRVMDSFNQDDLLEVMKVQCTKIHTDLVETTIANLSTALADVVEQYGSKSIISWDDPRFKEYGLDGYLNREDVPFSFHEWNTEAGRKNIDLAEQADLGITFSDVTLAESGTVVLFSDEGKGRAVSLLPTAYIAIVPKSTIVPRMSQATRLIHEKAESGERFPTCINFISGPSNSADIEMSLVVGVHGPIKATYIVVTDR
ncbi:lactate utilization protein C [Bacillus sp. Marseille-Q3570]|uniref:LutC/YkgG family protein n=1 Tax=Bacillus sp. Marseille-Q3570 TaxID=2963522 RepID=UPI0021B6FF66|nr:lactate utilization protein C [Bacillus sp. Marseille-Q3570]